MEITNNFLTSPYLLPEYFTKKECGSIIKLSKGITESMGQAGSIPQSDDLRKSEVRFIIPNDESAWVFEKLQAAILHANQHYNFHILGIREGLQIAEYKDNGHYTWHMDVGKEQSSTRKLGISVQLSEDSDYTGGELEFHSLGENLMSRSIGSAIIFPSYLLHRITPVTSGIRKSLVLWVHGEPFK